MQDPTSSWVHRGVSVCDVWMKSPFKFMDTIRPYRSL
jgi:hypothetical protein